MKHLRRTSGFHRLFATPPPNRGASVQPMNLVVRIPESASASFPDVLALARLAPSFTVEGQGLDRTCAAIFTDFPESLDLAVRLIGEVINIPDVWVSINARRVVSLTRFWSALICYRESLDEPDSHAYCRRKSAKFSDVAGCPDRACLSHCQFICTRCLGVVREPGAPPVSAQLLAIARQAEVDWCPNLKLP